jgi:tetratricopeptide (TPR) repeat protein
MKNPGIILLALMACAFTLLTAIFPRFLAWADEGGAGKSLVASIMGDSRALFANQLFTKGDVYMHSGYYPTIFDTKKLHAPKDGSKPEDHAAHKHDENGRCLTDEGETDILGKPLDWIDRFSRNFYITEHSHLEQGQQREMLPWLKFAAEMDPHQIDTYTVASFWLRTSLKKPKEAEEFLREGLRNNPSNPELLLELAKVYHDDYHNIDHARNLLEMAEHEWDKQEAPKANPDMLLLEQIVGRLADLEFKAGRYERALVHYTRLRDLSPAPKVIEEHIRKTQERIAESKRQ